MPRQVAGLNDTRIKSAKPKIKEYNLADGQGLCLRIKPNGTKLWLFNYQAPITKKRTNLGLGSYSSVSLRDARAGHGRCRELLANGINPKHDRSEMEQSI